MKKLILVITVIFVQYISYGQTNKKDSSKVSFYKAYEALKSMLEGKDSLNYEKAVFITENAYHNNYFNYEHFKSLIDFHTNMIKMYAENVRSHYKEKYKILNPWEQVFFKPNTDNWAIFKYMTDTAFVIIDNDTYYKEPYSYTYQDPYGSNKWENTQVLYLLLSNEKQGNCYALASLFKIFSDRLKSDARLTIAPHHIYIQNRNKRGDFYNVELASKSFPGDGTIQTLTYTTTTSIMRGMSQRMLKDKQAVALNLIYLAKSYQHKYNDNTNDFLLQCAELAFKYDTLSLNALLLKAEITENRLLASMKENKITKLAKARVNPQTQELLASYEKQLSNLYTYGYREIPKDIERVILAKIQHKESGSILKDQTPNPFKTIKAKQRYATLSNGLFDEMHEPVDSIQYYHALLNTKTKKITRLLPIETSDDYKVDPVVFALSVDPMADKYPNISPYAYCAWNPINIIDPDGRKIHPLDKASNTIIEEKAKKYGQALHVTDPADNNGIYGTTQTFQTRTEFTNYLTSENIEYSKKETSEAWDFYQALNTTDVFEVQITNTKTGSDNVLGLSSNGQGSMKTPEDMGTSNSQYDLFYNLMGDSQLSLELANAVYNGKSIYNPTTKSQTTINADQRGSNWAFFKNKNYNSTPTGTPPVKGVILINGSNTKNAYNTIIDAIQSTDK